MSDGEYICFSIRFPQLGHAVAMDDSPQGDTGTISPSLPFPQGKAHVRATLSLAGSIGGARSH